jgi:hypothetical protein
VLVLQVLYSPPAALDWPQPLVLGVAPRYNF